MAEEDNRLKALVDAGAMVQDNGTGAGGALYLPQHAELVDDTDGTRLLYYVEAGAEDQHHTHATVFDTVAVVHGRDLDFTLNGQRTAYMAPFAEWPEVSSDDMAERLAVARHAVATPDAAARFQRFVSDCKPLVGLN